MHTTRKLKRLRKRYLALILSFSAAYPSFVEAGWTRGRRSKQLICSVALLGAAVSTMPWWSETPPPNTPAWPGIGQLQADGRSMQESGLGVLMTFSAGAEETHVRVFEEGWLDNQVADRVKAKLLEEHPAAAELPNWSEPGLRVPLNTIAFVVDPKDESQAYVRLAGPFLQLHSSQPIPVEKVRAGGSFNASFTYTKTDEQRQGLTIRFTLDFEYDADRVLVGSAQMQGTIKAFGPFFFHEAKFRSGPWSAEAIIQMVER